LTVATSSTKEFEIDRIVRLAYIQAGLRPIEQGNTGIQWEQQATFGREMLELILKALVAEGLLVRTVREYLLTLTADDAVYTLPADVLDVFGQAVYIPAGEDTDEPETEQVIQQISWGQWQGLGNRTVEGVPSMYYPHRASGQVEVRFSPRPTEAGSVRFQAYYLSANATDGAATVDLERHWGLYLVYQLAYELAEAGGQPADKKVTLKGRADELLHKAKGFSRPKKGIRVTMDVRGPWSGR